VEVDVRYFAIIGEIVGRSAERREAPEGATVEDIFSQLVRENPRLERMRPVTMLMVNKEYVSHDHELHDGDELALIPPVSGGSTAAAPWVRVSAEPLSLDALAARVRDPRAGAVVTFSGVTREVERLEYEAYAEMAEERMAAIAAEALARHGLRAAAVEHRIGEVPLSDPSVIVAVSAAHRGEAFAGAREIIDRVKAEAPIWKKEIEGGEERWVRGTQPR
jgi:MoaE-MoaD fusion protein